MSETPHDIRRQYQNGFLDVPPLIRVRGDPVTFEVLGTEGPHYRLRITSHPYDTHPFVKDGAPCSKLIPGMALRGIEKVSRGVYRCTANQFEEDLEEAVRVIKRTDPCGFEYAGILDGFPEPPAQERIRWQPLPLPLEKMQKLIAEFFSRR